MDHGLHEKFNVGCKREENGFPERHACASITFDMKSNLNRDSKLFYLYKDITGR
jgi:hypothetical protein